MRNILYCFEGFPYPTRGGISKVSIRQVEFFRTKYQIHSYCLCLRIEPECIDTSVFEGFLVLNDAKEPVEQVLSYLREKKIDIVLFPVIWNIRLFKIVAKACKINGTKIISSIHGIPNQRLVVMDKYLLLPNHVNIRHRILSKIRPLYLAFFYLKLKYENSYVYENSEYFISLTDANMKMQVGFFKMKDYKKLIAIPNPLSYDEFISKECILNKKNEVLIVGRFEEQTKRISVALKIWSEIEKQINNWNLIIVGDGESRDSYFELARELNLKRVSFEGRQDPLSYYKRASIFMMTSSMEGFPMTLGEAMQNGVVPIAMDSFPAIHTIINDPSVGVLIPDNDLKTYSEKLIELIKNKEYRESLAFNSVQSSKRFSLHSVCDIWVRLFNKVKSCNESNK